MKKLLLVLGVFLLPCASWGESFDLMPDLAVEVALPSERWRITRQAPEFLVEEMAANVDEAMMEKARKAGVEGREAMARKMLSANELFVFNPESGAYLLVDFSPLRAGEKGPSRRAVAKSARYAGESLESEEGYGDVSHQTRRFSVEGADTAHRLDARFTKGGEKVTFVGIVGFSETYWFYLYFTDHLRREKDSAEMDRILETFRLRKKGE